MYPCNLVGQNIAKFRVKLNLSQEDLARELQLGGLSISRDSVAKIEARKQAVSDTQLHHIARALHVTVIELFSQPVMNQPMVNHSGMNHKRIRF